MSREKADLSKKLANFSKNLTVITQIELLLIFQLKF